MIQRVLVYLLVGNLHCMNMEGDLEVTRQNIATLKELNQRLDAEITARKQVADEYIRVVLGNEDHATA